MSKLGRGKAVMAADEVPTAVKPGGRIAGEVWSVIEAKAKLSEILRLARAGKPQTIGSQDPCVVISAAEFERLGNTQHFGRFLLTSAPKFGDIDLPSRADRRDDPFAED
jgi:prevent-host-death family protein